MRGIVKNAFGFPIFFLILKLVIALHIRNLLLQLLYLLLLENSLVLDWHYLDEILYVVVPVVEHGTGELTAGIEIMLTDQLVQLLAIGAVDAKRSMLASFSRAERLTVPLIVVFSFAFTWHVLFEISANEMEMRPSLIRT